MFCRRHRKNTSYKLWSEAATLTTMGSGWEQSPVGEACLQQYMGQFVISLYYSSMCKHRQRSSMSTNGLGIWCEVLIFSVIWWPHNKCCSHYIKENKAWWQCLVPTSTTRFASDAGYRMAKMLHSYIRKYFLWTMTPNSLTENEEHDIPSQILKTIFGLHASVIF